MLADADQARPTACARKWRLSFDDAIAPGELKAKTALLLEELTSGIQAGGGRLVGHIKGLIDAGDGGHRRFSITSFEEGARFKGEIVGGISEAMLTINVIVYGIEEDLVERVLGETFARHFRDIRSRDDGGEGDAR